MPPVSPMVNPLPNPMEKPLPREEEANPKPMPMPGEPPPAVDYYNFRDCAKSGEGCKLFQETLLGTPPRQGKIAGGRDRVNGISHLKIPVSGLALACTGRQKPAAPPRRSRHRPRPCQS